MRRFVTIQVLLALVPAVFSAPFLHLHGHENSAHIERAHRSRALVDHPHFPSGCSAGRANDLAITGSQGDDSSVSLNWFQDNPRPIPGLECVPAEAAVVPVLEPTAVSVELPMHCSHDPPFVFARSPRSPPALPASLGV